MTLDVSHVALEAIAEKGVFMLTNSFNLQIKMPSQYLTNNNLHSIFAKGYDVRYGARPLKRVLNKDILNPISRLVLEGSVLDGDTVRVRTRGEAKSVAKISDEPVTWISSNGDSGLDGDRNDIVVLRNHPATMGEEEEAWDDGGDYLMEDGVHSHR
jgi:hypothetical protein